MQCPFQNNCYYKSFKFTKHIMNTISVIVLTYNQTDTLSQTLDSILAQQCSVPFEIILGDDCSTDSTQEVCKKYKARYPDKIKLVLHNKNGGVVQNWLSCLKISKGKYITSCAGDDFWHNTDKLQLQVDFMEQNPECGILHSDFDELNTFTNKTILSFNRANKFSIKEGKVQKFIFDGSLRICAPTICYRKDLIDKYIPIKKYLELNFPIEDWPTNLIISHYANVNYLDISTVTYRKGHESISNPRSYEKTIDRFTREKQMYKYLCDMFPNDLAYDEASYDIYVNGVLLSLAYKRKDAIKAKEFALNMLKLGDKSWRTRISANWIGFWSWGVIKKIKG